MSRLQVSDEARRLRPYPKRNEPREPAKAMRELAQLDARFQSHWILIDRKTLIGAKGPLFPLRRSDSDFGEVFGLIVADERALLHHCKGNARRRQFFAVHAIYPALHQSVALARHAV